jgi:RimJ/RimL family protein N-acetyltransferase
LDHAFGELGLDKVYARVLRSNDASNRMFRNLGFSTDDTIKDVMIDGEAAEVIFYSILKKEWEAYEA